MKMREARGIRRICMLAVIASLVFLLSCSAEQGVLSKNPEKEKFVNFLPKDKFVFIELRETIDSRQCETFRHVWATPPDWIKEGYENWLAGHMPKDWWSKREGWAGWPTKPVMTEKTMAICAYSLYFYKFNGGYGLTKLVSIERLPSMLRLPEDIDNNLKDLHLLIPTSSSPLIRWPGSVELLKTKRDGTVVVRFKNGDINQPGKGTGVFRQKDKSVILAPGKRWSVSYFRKQEDGKQFEMPMMIINRGLRNRGVEVLKGEWTPRRHPPEMF